METGTNFDDFLVVVRGLKAVYSDPKFLPDKDAVKMWYKLLKDIPYKVLTLAAEKYMMQEKFPPTIADLRKKAVEIADHAQNNMSEMEAWALVFRALGNSIYNSEQEFAKLPALCQMALGNPSNLREMAMMDTDTVNSVEQSHFIRNYRVVCERKRADAQVSLNVRQAIAYVQQGGTPGIESIEATT